MVILHVTLSDKNLSKFSYQVIYSTPEEFIKRIEFPSYVEKSQS